LPSCPPIAAPGWGAILCCISSTIPEPKGFTKSVIEAQVTVIPFYERLGYVAEGDAYDDGSGILHRVMRRSRRAGFRRTCLDAERRHGLKESRSGHERGSQR
jgi:hypothetical protein